MNTLGFIRWNEETFSMQAFWAIGLFGLLLIILQAVFGLFVGHDGEAGDGADPSASIDSQGGHEGSSYLSIKSLSAMLLGFGFGGALLLRNGFSVGVSAAGGIFIGLLIGAAYIALMNSLYRLRSDGTAVLDQAVNRHGTVYLRIPGNSRGAGEIQVSFGGSVRNVAAFTRGPELPTGTPIQVIAVHGGTALLVEKLS